MHNLSVEQFPLLRLIKPRAPRICKHDFCSPDGKPAKTEYYAQFNADQRNSAYAKAHYIKHGNMYHSIRNRSIRFDIPKEQLNHCLTVEALNETVKQILLNRDYPIEIIDRILKKRKRSPEGYTKSLQ